MDLHLIGYLIVILKTN